MAADALAGGECCINFESQPSTSMTEVVFTQYPPSLGVCSSTVGFEVGDLPPCSVEKLTLRRAVISHHVPFLPFRDFRKEQKKISENSRTSENASSRRSINLITILLITSSFGATINIFFHRPARLGK